MRKILLSSALLAGGLFALPLVAQVNVMPAHFGPDAQRALQSNSDVLGQDVLSKGGPSFRSVASYFPAMRRPRAVVGVKDHPDFIGVTWDGALEVGSRRIYFAIGDPPSPYSMDGPVTRSLKGGYLPIVKTDWQFGGLLYQEEVLGYSKNFSPDEPLLAYVRLEVTNPGNARLATKISVYSNPALGGTVPNFTAEVAPKSKHDFYFTIHDPVDPKHLVTPISQSAYHQVVDETKAYWTRLLNQGMEIHTPEKMVNDAYRAWLMYNFLNVRKIKGDYQIHDGSGFYDQVYGYSAALYTDALARYGYSKAAELYLDSMLKHQQPDGLYETGFGASDNGALLFALAQEYELNHDLAWFKTIAPKMIKSCEWIQKARATTKTSGTGNPTFGLLPPERSYFDYRVPVHSYFTDAYNWLGMSAAAHAFQEAGMNSAGEKWSAEANDYRKDILASMQRSVVDVGGFKALPVEPLTQRLLKQGGGNYYALIAPLILETNIFGPKDPRVDWITKYMEERGGLLLGLDRFADGTDSAYTYGYAQAELRKGDVNKFLLTFYSTLAYGMSRGTYSSVEINHLIYGLNEMTLPHTYSGTQELRMLRLMLVRREGDNLLLASGTPRAWMKPGKDISVSRAPTRWGVLNYRLKANQDGHNWKMTIERMPSSTGKYPEHLEVWLRTPRRNKSPKQVMVNGKKWTVSSDGAVELPGKMLSSDISIQVKRH